MTVKELIAREEKKHAPKLIGDHIALAIYDKDTAEEYYFEDCRQADGSCDYADIVNAKVSSHEYIENYGGLRDKLKLNIEVE